MAVKRVSNSSRSQSASASAAAAAAAATASATPLSLSAEHEMILMEALLAHKPAGMHKHFRWEQVCTIIFDLSMVNSLNKYVTYPEFKFDKSRLLADRFEHHIFASMFQNGGHTRDRERCAI